MVRRNHNPRTLVILDYSGTLSPAMSRFARPESLRRALEKARLAEYGIDSPEKFWERVVNPTWHEGARTRIGYARLIVRTLGKDDDQRLCRAAEEFVRLYMSHAVIDERWLPLLSWLVNLERVTVLVATDHYAEATERIVKEFEINGFSSLPLGDDRRKDEGTVLVANSSDLGYLKSERGYWQKVGCLLDLTFDRVILIDDFGQAEEEGDAYREKIRERREKMIEALSYAFRVPIEVYTYAPMSDFLKMAEWLKKQVSPDNAVI